VRLKSTGREPIETVMEEIRSKIETQVPGVNIELAQLMEDLIGDLTAVPQPVQIKIYSDDQNTLEPPRARSPRRSARFRAWWT
jgi:Putative silver efflux pump